MTVKYRLTWTGFVSTEGIYLMDDLAPCHNYKRTRTFLECNGIPVLKWPGNSPERNSIINFWVLMRKEIVNQMLCLKEEMWKRVCEAWYSVAPNVWKIVNEKDILETHV